MSPPWVLLDQQEGDMYGEEPGWTWIPEGPPPTNTWKLRRSSSRKKFDINTLTFVNALRACSEMWWKTLTAGQRDDFVYNGPYPRGPRPGRPAGPDNGWNAFVMMAFAPFYFNKGKVAAFHPDDETDPLGVDFTVADPDTQLMHFVLHLNPAAPVECTGYMFVYQIHPLYIGLPDENRRTTLAGGYATIPNGPDDQGFSAEAPHSFASNDSVHVLLRYHQMMHGVINYQRSQDAI